VTPIRCTGHVVHPRPGHVFTFFAAGFADLEEVASFSYLLSFLLSLAWHPPPPGRCAEFERSDSSSGFFSNLRQIRPVIGPSSALP